MTRDEIIQMARQAGMMTTVLYLGRNLELLTNFAKLVAEKERDAFTAHAMTSAEKAIDVAIKLEREKVTKERDMETEQDCVGWFGYDTGLRLWFETNEGDDGAIPLYKRRRTHD